MDWNEWIIGYLEVILHSRAEGEDKKHSMVNPTKYFVEVITGGDQIDLHRI